MTDEGLVRFIQLLLVSIYDVYKISEQKHVRIRDDTIINEQGLDVEQLELVVPFKTITFIFKCILILILKRLLLTTYELLETLDLCSVFYLKAIIKKISMKNYLFVIESRIRV